MENLENILENYNAGLDLPDARDYTTDELDGFGGNSAENLPKKFMLTETVNHNQGHIGACTLFGSVNAYNETIKQEKISLARTWELWAEAKKRGASDTAGWYLQFALQLLKDFSEIKGYIRLDLAGFANVEKMKSAIVSGKAVVTGVLHGNWQEVVRTHEWKRTNRVSGHIFDIVGYDDEYVFADGTRGGFYVENSWGNSGYFWLKYSDISELFSQYIFENVEKISEKRRTKNLQKAFDAKIWNEERPDDTAVAHEIRIMINRALGLRYDFEWLRSSLNYMLEDKISRGKIKLYNEKDKYKIATDEEIAIMFNRAVIRDPDINVEELSREQVAEVIGRDFL